MKRDTIYSYLLSQPKEVWLKVANIDTRMYVSCVLILLKTICVRCQYEGDIYCSVVTASATLFELNLIRQLRLTLKQRNGWLPGRGGSRPHVYWHYTVPLTCKIHCIIIFCLTPWHNSHLLNIYVLISKSICEVSDLATVWIIYE
jgi:hypothetical protein